MMKVQQAKPRENQAACQDPVARSVYQAVLTSGLPHQLGPWRLKIVCHYPDIVTSDQPHLCSLRARVLRVPDTPVDLTELVVEYRLSRDPADITLAGLCMSPDVSYTIQYKKIDVLFTNNASSQIMADRRYYSLQTTDLPPTGCAPESGGGGGARGG